MPLILEEFLKQNNDEIQTKGLRENFILHLINLYDHQTINSDTFAKITKKLAEMSL
jgi:hypothetical protein